MKIGVYGLGRFGSFWAETLLRTGNEVLVYSRSSHAIPNGCREVKEAEVLSCDLLFFCVSISSFESVLIDCSDRIGKNTIVLDTCSVKTYPKLWMEKHLRPDTYKIATHPMFGPDSAKNGLENLPIVLSSISEKDERFKLVKSMFEQMGLRAIEMSAEEHDREAAFSQGVTHFIGRVLSKMQLGETDIATKGYKSLLEIEEQTCNDPMRLFIDLQQYNPFTKDMRHSLRLAIEEVGYILEKGEEQ